MKVLFFAGRDLAHPLAGGSEVLVDRLATGLIERGHQVSLLCGGPVDARPYQVVDTGGTYDQYLRAPLRAVARHRGADVVVDVVNGVPFFSPLWHRGAAVCLINHIHLEEWRLWFPRPMAAVGRSVQTRLVPALYRRCLFMAVSESTAAGLRRLGVPDERIRVVHNGVDSCDRPAVKAAEPLFVALGRLVPQKRFELLLEMWEHVRPVTGGRLVIAGDGPERDRLRAVAGAGVSLPGHVPEDHKHRLLDAAWLLVHPSMIEGWGLVIMEAAAHGTPTLGFDVPGVRDSVVDGRSGQLVRSKAELARAWIAMAGDHKLRHDLGQGARLRAGRFSWSNTVDGFLAVVDDARAQRGHASQRLVEDLH
ncbi:MAG: glycosyltransferase family 4 protein [Actinomycetota bacterium]|nr:glycosyltransferase family 4 protein [Actinomycetota bacterium]